MARHDDLLDQVVQALKQTLQPPGSPMELESLCSGYNQSDYERYAIGDMNLDERSQLEAHSRECPICREGMAAARERSELECAALTARSLEYLNTLENKKPPGLGQIALKLGRDLVQAITSAGWTGLPSPALQTRGSESAQGSISFVKLRRLVGEPPISVEITGEKAQGEFELKLSVSLFNNHTEAFLTDVQVEAKGGGFHETTITDKEGVAQLVLPAPGEYDLRIGDAGGFYIIIPISVKTENPERT